MSMAEAKCEPELNTNRGSRSLARLARTSHCLADSNWDLYSVFMFFFFVCVCVCVFQDEDRINQGSLAYFSFSTFLPSGWRSSLWDKSMRSVYTSIFKSLIITHLEEGAL